jgi:hypothetical protein
MNKNPKCQGRASLIECDTDFADYFKVSHRVFAKEWTTVECVAHAAHSEGLGKPVELIK